VIYAPLARRIFETGSLPSGSLYEGYPMLVPLAYAYSHWVVGGLNESVARLVPAIMALGAIGAAGVLGRDMRSPRIGLASAGLVALTPLFGRWASTGYVDVPASFYFVLTAVAAWRWLRTSMWQDAVLTGLFCGLALFTKSDALTLLVSLAALIVLRRRQERAGASLRWSQVGWMGVALLGVAAPWYLRNLAVNGFLLPPTIWIASARHDGTTALILLRDFQHFSLPGWLFTASLVYGGVQAVRSGWRRRLVWATLLAFAVPFLAAWWWLASYDERFLVSIVPILSVMAGLFIDDSLAWLNPHLGRTAVRWAAWACVALILVLAVPAFQKTVEGKRAILRNPRMSDAEKHRELLGGQYDLALEVDRLPPGSRVLGLPSRLMYYVDGLHLGGIGTGIAESPPWDRAGDYDYVVYRFSLDDKPEWACHVEPIFQSDDGYHLYTTDPAGVLPTSACDPG
jgi:4-amino-4-deoxy-L-arabinose transferase-like glycosyltransferase